MLRHVVLILIVLRFCCNSGALVAAGLLTAERAADSNRQKVLWLYATGNRFLAR